MPSTVTPCPADIAMWIVGTRYSPYRGSHINVRFIIRWRGLISFGETSEEYAAAAAAATTTASNNAQVCLALRSQAGSQPRPGKQPRSGEEEPVTERPVSRCSVKAVITARKHERGKTGCTAIHAVQHSNGTGGNRQVSANISPTLSLFAGCPFFSLVACARALSLVHLLPRLLRRRHLNQLTARCSGGGKPLARLQNDPWDSGYGPGLRFRAPGSKHQTYDFTVRE